MILTIDIGNSSTVFGLFDNQRLKKTWRISSETNAIKQWFKKNKKLSDKIVTVRLSSVVPSLTIITQKASQKEFRKPLYLPRASSIPLKIKTRSPNKIGIDRLIDAYAARTLWKNKNILVVDLGTATTLDVVTSHGDFLGGLILPGPQTMHRSLNDHCEQLPLLPLKKTSSVIGKSTKEAIQGGVYWGYVSLLEGLIKRIQKQFKKPIFVVATGGLAPIIATSVAAINHIHPTLTLEGLRLIHINHSHILSTR